MSQSHQNNHDVSEVWLRLTINIFKTLFSLISQMKERRDRDIMYGNVQLTAIKMNDTENILLLTH